METKGLSPINALQCPRQISRNNIAVFCTNPNSRVRGKLKITRDHLCMKKCLTMNTLCHCRPFLQWKQRGSETTLREAKPARHSEGIGCRKKYNLKFSYELFYPRGGRHKIVPRDRVTAPQVADTGWPEYTPRDDSHVMLL